MTSTSLCTKHKIILSDYDYKSDVRNRILLSSLSGVDFCVLEEILYNPLKIPMKTLFQNIPHYSAEHIVRSLEKLSSSQLFKVNTDHILVNKEVRKYFESQIVQFEKGFVPGIEFLCSLLKKLPIDVLMEWYCIPKTSDNIFYSLIEDYLEEPCKFEQYLSDLSFEDPVCSHIVEDVFASPNYQVDMQATQEKYNLSREEIEIVLLHLEFCFVCCGSYEKAGDNWKGVITLFKEWKEHLYRCKRLSPHTISQTHKVKQPLQGPYAFTRFASQLLQLTAATPLDLILDENEMWSVNRQTCSRILDSYQNPLFADHLPWFQKLVTHTVNKLLFIKIAKVNKAQLITAEGYQKWLSLSLENRTLRVDKFTFENYDFKKEESSDRTVKEIQKNIMHLIGNQWRVLKGVKEGYSIALNKKKHVRLKKTGKHWCYVYPKYSTQELRLIELAIEWLFEAGMIDKGIYQNEECVRITDLGSMMFQ